MENIYTVLFFSSPSLNPIVQMSISKSGHLIVN